jgi:hypothetical protein
MSKAKIRLVLVFSIFWMGSWAVAQQDEGQPQLRIHIDMKKLDRFTPAHKSLYRATQETAVSVPFTWFETHLRHKTDTFEMIAGEGESFIYVFTGNFDGQADKLASEVQKQLNYANRSESIDSLIYPIGLKCQAVTSTSIAVAESNKLIQKWCEPNSELQQFGKESLEQARKVQPDAAIHFVLEPRDADGIFRLCQFSGGLELSSPIVARVMVKGVSEQLLPNVVEDAVDFLNSTLPKAQSYFCDVIRQAVVAERINANGASFTEFFGLDDRGEPLVTAVSQIKIHGYRDGDKHQISIVLPWKRP